MLFPTTEFAIFFFIVFFLHLTLKRHFNARKAVLVVASYIFYAFWNWHFTFLLFEFTLFNYVCGLWLESLPTKKAKNKVLILGVTFNLAVLAYFKYYGFFLSSLSDLLLTLGLERDIKIVEVLLPVGVSFFTFQGLSYLVDIYRGKIEACTSIIDFMLFKSFFPQLVAGPIVRAKDFLPQLRRAAESIQATRAFLLIAVGLVKKVIIAHYLSVELVNPVFEAPTEYSTLDVLCAAYGYAVQIYCDFSAYTDLAIGLALLFGFSFPKNFNQPYRAESLQDFWHRWHISLSSWLRDYLYIPLGGSKNGKLKTYRNLFLTMVLGGLWHGAAWNFIFWGFLHGIGLCIERFWRERLTPASAGGVLKVIRIAAVFHFVCIAWIFFASDSFSHAVSFLGALGNYSVTSTLITPFAVGLLLIGFLSQFLPEDVLEECERGFERIPVFAQGAMLGFLILAVSAASPGALAPFIYFRF